ncbi:MAG: TonB-dependent receptor [Gemmatimonadetes bacterium]|nr:TonB-dependent receptor [Gemmatimonadota bacterium]MYG34949.1 TonB-dependent receptor [Gemmatimonadota bacterium]
MPISRRVSVLSFLLGMILADTPTTLRAGTSPVAITEGASQQDGTVSGTVRAADSGAPILLASVRIEPTNQGASTDADGRFTIYGVPEGAGTLVVSAVGYDSSRMPLTIGTDVVEIEIQLEVDPLGVDGLTVSAARSRVATKAETELLATPQAISLVPGAVIEQQAAVTLDDVIKNVSGLIQASSINGEYATFAARGFYSNSNGNFRRNGVQVSKFGELLDANTDRVEVLKGPATVLYGQLDPGGVINLRTKQPLGATGTEVRVAGGSFGRVDGRIDATGRLFGPLLYRVNAQIENRDSYRDEVFWRTRFISPVITWHAGPATTLTVETEFKREEGLLDEGLFAPAPTLASLDEQPVNRFLGEPDVPADRARSAVLARLEQGIGGSWSTRIATSWSKNERNANRVDLRSLGGDGRTLGRRTDFRQQELETLFWDAGLIGALQLGPTSHRVAVGLDGYSTTRLEERFRGPVDPIDIFLPRYTGAVAPSPFAVEDQSVDMLGLYAQDQIALGDAFVLQLGLRYTTFDQLTVDRDDGTEEDFSDQELTTSAGVVHRVTPDVSIYGSMSEAFAPTLSVDRNGDAFDPNFGRQFELGLKADLLDRRLSTTIALYHLRRTGMISFVYPPEGGFYRVQSGVQRSRGFEVDLLGRLTGSVSAIASYGFTDGAVLEDDVYETGHGLGGAPRHHGSLWLRGGLGNGFYAGAGVFFQSEWKAFTSYPDDRMLRGYHRFEAMAGYSLANGVRLQLNGRNLANKRYYLSGGEGRAVGLPASPRSFELSVSWGTGALRR